MSEWWNRKHDRPHFFKYASCRSALLVIQSKKFRWSSPLNFNDPFDHQSGFAFSASWGEDIARELIASAERMIFTDAQAQTGASRDFTELLLRLRSFRNRVPRSKILAEMHGTTAKIANNFRDSAGPFNDQLHEHLCHSRVFCVSEVPDNVVMWSHYANEHRGVVFKLRCDKEVDNTLLIARKVEYSSKFVTLPDAKIYAKYLTGEATFDMPALCWDIAYTKHQDWSYEREWRVHMPLHKEPAGDGYSYYQEDPKIFEAIYLGCRMPPEDVQSIKEAIRIHLPDTAIFQVRRSNSAFELELHKAE